MSSIRAGDEVLFNPRGEESLGTRKGTVKLSEKWGMLAIQDEQGAWFDDPLVFVHKTEDAAYPAGERQVREKAANKRRSIKFSRNGLSWKPFEKMDEKKPDARASPDLKGSKSVLPVEPASASSPVRATPVQVCPVHQSVINLNPKIGPFDLTLKLAG